MKVSYQFPTFTTYHIPHYSDTSTALPQPLPPLPTPSTTHHTPSHNTSLHSPYNHHIIHYTIPLFLSFTLHISSTPSASPSLPLTLRAFSTHPRLTLAASTSPASPGRQIQVVITRGCSPGRGMRCEASVTPGWPGMGMEMGK